MLRLLQAVALGAGLIAAAGTAHAQSITTSNTSTRHVLSINGSTAELLVEDGVASLTVNGEEYDMPSMDGDWTTFIVQDQEGNTLGTITRPTPGSTDVRLLAQGLPRPLVVEGVPIPGAARGVGGRFALAAPDAPGGGVGIAVAPIVPEPPRVMIGVRLTNDVPRNIARLGFDPTKATAISFVVEGSPAERAGLRPGDVIVGIGGEQAGGAQTISAKLRELDPGDEIAVVIVREEQIEQLAIEVAPFDNRAFGGRELSDAERAELDDRVGELDARLEELRDAMALQQLQLQNAEDPRELANTIRDLSQSIAELNRERAELSAQRSLMMAQRGIVEGQRLAEDAQRRFPGVVTRGGRDLERFFFEGDEDLPFAIIREFVGEDESETVRELVEMFSDGELDEEFGDMIRFHLQEMLGGEEDENFELDLDMLNDFDEMQGEVWEVIEEQEDRMSRMERRLERIEELLERLVDDR